MIFRHLLLNLPERCLSAQSKLLGCLSLALITSGLLACQAQTPAQRPSQSSSQSPLPVTGPPSSNSDDEFIKVQDIMSKSCLPCHSRQSLPLVISQLKQANVDQIEGQNRLRIVAELESLERLMEAGNALSFEDKREVHQFFEGHPGSLYIMLERGKMPPAWAPALMKQISWSGYQELSIENRIELLKYAKSYAVRTTK